MTQSLIPAFFRIMKLGEEARKNFPVTKTLDPIAGATLYTMGFATGLVLWGFGLVWLCVAVASIIQCRRFPFTIGWWGCTFPLGVFANSTVQLSKEVPSDFFRILGTVSFLVRRYL